MSQGPGAAETQWAPVPEAGNSERTIWVSFPMPLTAREAAIFVPTPLPNARLPPAPMLQDLVVSNPVQDSAETAPSAFTWSLS